MPLYEYQCEKCGDVFELMQKFVDAPLETHETCGGAVHRLISAPALQFKGSGWYVNDYAKGSTSPAANGGSKKADSTDSSGSSSDPAATTAKTTESKSSESKSSDTKPASSSDTK